MSAPTAVVHMIGHGHIDPTWLWRWTEGYEEVRATFRSALERMEEEPELRFTASSAQFHAWVERCDPELFAAIQRKVAEGRWEIAGGWWVEPDCNLPCGESFVRQGLYAQRYFQRAFGVRARVGFNPDSFGHAGTFPQIYRKLGIAYYAYMRPGPPGERDYPGGCTFQWEAGDGSRVLAALIPYTYNSDGEGTRQVIRALPTFAWNTPGVRHLLGFFGVGNHGGGPTRAAMAAIRTEQNAEGGPEVRYSTLSEFFDAVEADADPGAFPVARGDLQHHARGCYTAHAGIKAWNRRAEHALMSAERWAAARWWLDAAAYPGAEIEEAWKLVCYNQFHDILAGSSIASAYEDARDQLGAVRHLGATVTNEAIQTLARDIDTTTEGNTIVVANPLPWAVRQPVRVSAIAGRTLSEPVGLVDDEGAAVAVQAVKGERIGHTDYVFLAEPPGLGYRCYHLRSGGEQPASDEPLHAGRDFLENAWWRLELDPDTGAISRLLDRKYGVDVLECGNVLACLVDGTDTWSHDMVEWRVEAGRFAAVRRAVEEQGPVRATLRVDATYGRSQAHQFISLYRDIPAIDLTLHVNWQERYTFLKLLFETRIRNAHATNGIAYGYQERPLSGGEEPFQQWVDLTGNVEETPYGVALLSDGKYGFDVRDGVVRISLLRSPAYGYHDPSRHNSDEYWPVMDQGEHVMRFRLTPHAQPWRDASVARSAWELDAPCIAHVESAHPGTRPQRASFVSVDAESVVLSVVKKSEDGDDLVLRGYESTGHRTAARITVAGLDQPISTVFGPHEIKTLRIRRDGEVSEANLLEESEGSEA